MRLHKFFSSLRWKLVFSYVGVTLATVLALEVVFLMLMGIWGQRISDIWITQSALNNARQLAQLAAAPLETGNTDRLTQILYQPTGLVFKVQMTEEVDKVIPWSEPRAVIGRDGLIIASNQPERYPAGSRFQEPEWPRAEELVTKALRNSAPASDHSDTLNMFVIVIPITSSKGQLLGLLYYQQPKPNSNSWSPADLVGPLAITTLLLLPLMVPLGLVFGFVTATSFTRRLHRLTQASNALANGNLDQRVPDMSGDEIGQLTRQFNRMAEQLETDTIQLRELADHNARLAQQAQRLAALEERHRLARELHDGIKQNLFGINLATATASNLLETDTEAARTKLLEAQEYSRQAQTEMQSLLEELRPAGLEERGLLAVLEDYLTTFERRQGIKVDWQPGMNISLSPAREQVLYRVTQEALANVARHAHATRVSVMLDATPEAVTLRITDNGQGFDPSAVQPGSTLGLQGMRERLTELNGTLAIDAVPNAGTQLTATLPQTFSRKSS